MPGPKFQLVHLPIQPQCHLFPGGGGELSHLGGADAARGTCRAVPVGTEGPIPKGAPSALGRPCAATQAGTSGTLLCG